MVQLGRIGRIQVDARSTGCNTRVMKGELERYNLKMSSGL